jgi:NADH:ubiquinone oxidoreductase subunit F (NADH-binding)
MKTVTTLEDAMNFFLNNSSGNCIAVKNGIEKEISCYPEAVEFFK